MAIGTHAESVELSCRNLTRICPTFSSGDFNVGFLLIAFPPNFHLAAKASSLKATSASPAPTGLAVLPSPLDYDTYI